MLFGIQLTNILMILVIALCVKLILKVTGKILKFGLFVTIVICVARIFGYI